jgi:hypothetical protein
VIDRAQLDLFEIRPVVVDAASPDEPPKADNGSAISESPSSPPSAEAQADSPDEAGKLASPRKSVRDMLVPLGTDGFLLDGEHPTVLWLRIMVPADTPPGTYHGRVGFETEAGITSYRPLAVRVFDVSIADPADYALGFDVWQLWSDLEHYYGVAAFSEDWWKLVGTYLEHLAGMGARVAQVGRAYFDWKRSAPGQWQFDFSRFDRYISLCEQVGINKGIAYVAMLNTAAPTKVYYHDPDGEFHGIESEPGQDIYDEAWTAFADALFRHCRTRDWFHNLRVWVADRPQTDEELATFKRAVDLLWAVDPDYQVVATIDTAAAASWLPEHADRFVLFGDQMPGQFGLLVASDREATTTTAICRTSAPHLAIGRDARDPYAVGPRALWGFLDAVVASTYLNWPEGFDVDAPQVPDGFSGLVYPSPTGPLMSLRAERFAMGMADAELWAMAGAEKTWAWWLECGGEETAADLSNCVAEVREKALQAVSRHQKAD